MKTKVSVLSMFLTMMMAGPTALSSIKMDIKTHNSLIEKLESVTDQSKSDSMIKQHQLYYRLADLYSERSRLWSMENEGRGEQLSKKLINADRKKAINIYKRILPLLKNEEKNHALLQTAHLHNLLLESSEAIKIYKSIVNNPKSVDEVTLALAKVQLGDIWFYKAEYAASEKILTEATTIKSNPRMGYTYYRIAWCSFNSGNANLAKNQLIELLEKKQLFVSKSGDVDNSFKEEVSRDLATFMASNESITESDINTLMKLTPEPARQKNLIYLATELDRTGKKKSSIIVWKKIGKQNLSFEDELEGQIRITKIQYDLGQRGQLLKEIDNSIKLLKSSNCPKNAECLVGQQNLRKILTQWGNAEQRVPTTELVLGFKKYNDAFKDDEMSSWAGHTAMKKKMYNEAYLLFVSSAEIISGDREKLKTEKGRKVLEGSLLGAIEAAESMNNAQTKLDAYNLYLSLNPQGQKRFEVRYQKAQVYYKSNSYEKAFSEFYNLAVDNEAPSDLRDKSSELSLDTLVLLKREDELEKTSAHFASVFKGKREHFLNINRKSILNQSAKVINATEEKVSDLEFQWTKLKRVESQSWPFEQKKILIKNKMALANKLKNQEMIVSVADEIIKDGRYSVEDKNKALKQKAWIYEVKLDFASAIVILSQLRLSANELPDHYFKLALLTELSKKDPTDYYKKYLKVSKDNSKKNFAIHQIILHSANPYKEFKARSSALRTSSQLYLSAGIFAYEKSKDHSLIKKVLAQAGNKGSFEYALLKRHVEISDLTTQLLALKKVKVNSSISDKKLQRNLALKIQLISELDRLAQRYIRKKDNTMQILTLAHVSNQNQLLAQDILSLPIPKKLTPAQQKQYQEQIQLKIRPFVAKSESVRLRTIQMYQDSVNLSVFKDLYDLSVQKNKPGSYLAQIEVEHLRRSAGLIGIVDDPFINFTRERHKVASEAERLEQRLHDNPYDYNDLQTFIRTQKELGSGAYVAYLEERLNATKRGTN